MFDTLFCSRESVTVYCDTWWGWQVRLCFTSELGKTLHHNGFSANGIDHSRVRLIVWEKVTFQTVGFNDRPSLLMDIHCYIYSVKDNTD